MLPPSDLQRQDLLCKQADELLDLAEELRQRKRYRADPLAMKRIHKALVLRRLTDDPRISKQHAQGKRDGKRGRKSMVLTPEQLSIALDMHVTLRQAAALIGVSETKIYRIRKEVIRGEGTA